MFVSCTVESCDGDGHSWKPGVLCLFSSLFCVCSVFSGFGDGGAADGMGHGSSSCHRTVEDLCAGQWIPNYHLCFLGAGLSSTLFMAQFGVREHLYLFTCACLHVFTCE